MSIWLRQSFSFRDWCTRQEMLVWRECEIIHQVTVDMLKVLLTQSAPLFSDFSSSSFSWMCLDRGDCQSWPSLTWLKDAVILPSRRKVHGISFWLSWECVLLPGRHLHVVTWGSMACRRQLTATAVESFLLSFLAHSQIDCAHSSYCLHSLQKRCVFNIKQYLETIIVTTAWGIVNTFIWFRGLMSFRARSGPSVREADTHY